MSQSVKTIVIEIEGEKGTLAALELDLDTLIERRAQGCAVADVDNDYIFGTDSPLVRVQLSE